MDFHIIIPARFHSERLPEKILAVIAGKPLIQYVYERALLCGAKSVSIATDHPRIKQVAEEFGAPVYMTETHHSSGTLRIAEAAQILNLTEEAIVVNIQGDEPLMPPAAVQLVVKAMVEQQEAAVATLCTPILQEKEIFDPNLPKVILDKQGFALYFSRAPIPWDREAFDVIKNRYYRHIGLYAYRVKTLKKYHRWEPSPLEEIEKLEQLRVLWHGEKIHVSKVEEPLPPGIDTPADLARFRIFMETSITT